MTGGNYTIFNSGTAAWTVQVGTTFKDNPDVAVTPGGIVTFRLQQSSQHPFGFSTVRGDKNQPTITTKNYQIEADSGCRFYNPGAPTAAYLPVDTTGAIPCILKWTVPTTLKTGDLYYQCHGHPQMTGAFVVQAAPTDNSTSSTTATPTTATPTTTPTPTPTPASNTTPPPTPTPTTTSPPTNSNTSTNGNVTTPTNGTSSTSIPISSSSSTGTSGSNSTTGAAGAASNLVPSIGIMFLIAAVMATIPL